MGLQAPNRAHNLRTYFDPRGVRLHDRTRTGSPELTTLSLIGMGRGVSLTPVDTGTVVQVGSRVEIRRPTVVEWYENSAQGLEQGFTMVERPHGQGPLVLELDVASARAALSGNSVVLITDAGRRLNYGGLIVHDASGHTLNSHLEVPGSRRVRLVVDDAGAEYPIVIDPLITGTPDAMLQSNQPDPPGFKPAAFGGTVASAGDVNGDGFDDVIVGAPGWDGGDAQEGGAFVFLGSATGIVGSDPLSAHARIESNQFGAQLGTIAGAGDVNGDGFDDIVVGAHFYRDVLPGTTLAVDGAAFVFLGSATGIVGNDPFTSHAWIKSKGLGSELGISVAGAGDINGDGFDDLLVGAPRQGIPFPPNIPPNDNSGNGGAVLVFHGSAAGIVGTGFGDADAKLLPYPPGQPVASGANMGRIVSGAGDVNGDGFADLVTTASGEALVFLGSLSGIVGTDPTTAHARIAPADPDAALFSVAAAGDVNGDGFGDIIVGAPFYPVANSTTQEGAAFVFLGGASGIGDTDTSTAQARLQGSLLAEWVGMTVSGAGDVDGDGFDDVVISARIFPGSLNNEGTAYVFRGSPGGIAGSSLLDAYVRLSSGQSGAAVLGQQVAFGASGAGDVNGDGFADTIMGAGFFDAGQENEGAAFVFHGGPASVTPNQPPVAKAGPDKVLMDIDNTGTEAITLDGTASFDADGSIVGFRWLEGETLLGTQPVLTTELAATGDHVLVLTVTDDAGVTRGDPVTVRVDRVPKSFVAFEDFSSGGFAGGIGAWSGGWTLTGDVALSGLDTFPSPPQARLGSGVSTLSRAVTLPAGATGLLLEYWGKAGQFGASDQVQVMVQFDGSPFAVAETITVADSDNTYRFRKINSSWFPSTATTAVIAFESNRVAGQFTLDDVRITALVAPTTNQNPIANAGPDQVVTDGDDNGSEPVTLDASASTDPDGSIVGYAWREGTTLLGTTAVLTTTLGIGDHVLTLTVTDSAGASSSDTVTVSVVVAPVTTTGVASDDFESRAFGGGTGRWVGAWVRGGDVRMTLNNAGPHSGSSHVRLRKSNAFLRRTVDLSGVGNAQLSYWGKPRRLQGSDRLLIKISVDGGPFTTVETVTSAAPNNVYRLHEIDLSGFPATANVRIEFDSNVNSGMFYIDDVEITGLAGPAPNKPPIANAGVDQVISDLNGDAVEVATLDGSGSTDSDGSIVAYRWSEGATTLGITPIVNTSLGLGSHSIVLTVTDSDGATANDTLTVTVGAFNQPPVANAGPDLTVTDVDGDGFEVVTFDGSASSDADGTLVAYQWREGLSTLGNTSTFNVTLATGTHLVTLTVTDNAGATSTDTVQVIVVGSVDPAQASVTLSGSALVNRGDDVSFTVTLTNTGTSALTNVELSFGINPSRNVKNVNPAGTVLLPDVPPGASVSRVWTGQADKEGTATVTAEAFSAGTSIASATQVLTVMK